MHKGETFVNGYCVSQEVYDGFIRVFSDKNPLHTSSEFAQSKGFRAPVMHGNILNGFISHFIGECLPTKDVMIYSQKIDFKKPVYLGDKLTLHCTIDDVHESVNLVEFSFSFVNEDSVKVAKGKIQIGLLK